MVKTIWYIEDRVLRLDGGCDMIQLDGTKYNSGPGYLCKTRQNNLPAVVCMQAWRRRKRDMMVINRARRER